MLVQSQNRTSALCLGPHGRGNGGRFVGCSAAIEGAREGGRAHGPTQRLPAEGLRANLRRPSGTWPLDLPAWHPAYGRVRSARATVRSLLVDPIAPTWPSGPSWLARAVTPSPALTPAATAVRAIHPIPSANLRNRSSADVGAPSVGADRAHSWLDDKTRMHPQCNYLGTGGCVLLMWPDLGGGWCWGQWRNCGIN